MEDGVLGSDSVGNRSCGSSENEIASLFAAKVPMAVGTGTEVYPRVSVLCPIYIYLFIYIIYK